MALHRKLRSLGILVSLSALAGCALADRSAGHRKLENVPWKNKNIIVVLGMRSERSGGLVMLPKFAQPRVREAERLYGECKAAGKVCLILASGGDPANNGVSEAVLIQRQLLRNKIPATDILIEEKSSSTTENAEYSSKILAQQSPDLTVLVTSDIHLPRALKNFEEYKVFALPAPAFGPT